MIYLFLANGFEEVEALCPLDLLRRAGLQVMTVGVGGEMITGSHGISIQADIPDTMYRDSKPEMIILPGGMPGSKNLRDNERVLALVRAMVAENKVTAAICAAPIVLEKAGILKGIRYTMYPGFEAEMSSRPTGNLTEVCGNIITGKGPGAAFAFAACVAKALGSDADPMYRDGMFIQG